MELLLIGLADDLAKSLEDAAANAGISSRRAPNPEGCGGLEAAAMAVLDASAWKAWSALPATARPPAYVVTYGKLTDEVLREGRELPVVGHAPAGGATLPADVLRRLREVARPDEPSTQDVGTLVEVTPSRDEPVLVGWAMRGAARQRVAMRSVCASLRPMNSPSPFEKLRASAWLVLYSHLKFATPMAHQVAWAWEQAQLLGFTPAKRGALERAFEEHFFTESESFNPILVVGETGTGKTIVAKQIHRALEAASGRELPSRHVNCSTLGELAQSELFGAIQGAFTSRDSTTPGSVLSAYGGTLFLDEIGTLGTDAQAQLLLLLQDGTITPMGWLGDPIHVPVQVVAATNAHLEVAVTHNEFRADLLYRFPRRIELPPLRELKHVDLPYLVDYLLQLDNVNAATDTRTPRKDTESQRAVEGISQEALDKLMRHDYPGNFRELDAVMRRAIDSARNAHWPTLTSADITFGPSTLPRQNGVVAFIYRDGAAGREFLLLWNAHWNCYFLPSGRLKKGETSEAGLRRELQLKLGLRTDDWTLSPVPGVPEVSAIQFSVRDGQLKHHFFRPFFAVSNSLREDTPGTCWLSADTTQWPSSLPDARLSPTLELFRALLHANAST